MPKRSRYKSYSWIHPKSKKLYARVQIRQSDGTMKTYLKPADNKTHVEQLAAEMLADYAVRQTGFIEGEKMTFRQLAEWYKSVHSIPPVYAEDGTKVTGIRTFQNERNKLDAMIKFFGDILIKNIDEDVLESFKLKREKDGVKVSTVNRDLEILRAMMGKAVRRRWLKESPFDFGEKLIKKSLEKRRDVILTPEMETAILAAAKGAEKTLLYYVVLCLLDTGARPSEIYDASTIKGEPVCWSDFFDYDFKAVKLTSYKSNKKRVRFAPVTNRLESAMKNLWNSFEEKDKTSQIFPVKSFKRSWTRVRREADYFIRIAKKLNVSIDRVFDNTFSAKQVENARKSVIEEIELEKSNKNYKPSPILSVRLRDLRRNLSTRLANLGMENDLRQRILGHEQSQTTFDYTSADLQTALAAKQMLDNEITQISDAIN